MGNKGIIVTEQIREAINEFLGTEMIPPCAIGSQIIYNDGDILLKTFKDGKLEGYRKLQSDGELLNIITETNTDTNYLSLFN